MAPSRRRRANASRISTALVVSAAPAALDSGVSEVTARDF